MEGNGNQPVIVGSDGSPGARAAIAWAAERARLRTQPLVVVRVSTWPPVGTRVAPVPQGVITADLVTGERQLLDEDVAFAAGLGAVRVTGAFLEGSPAGALIARSHHADLVVVGQRGLGGFSGLLLGSVSAQVAGHAACPVAVLRERAEPDPAGFVVVGVDGSPAAHAALVFGYQEAVARGHQLVVVHATEFPVDEVPLDQLVAGLPDRPPAVVVRPVQEPADPRDLLIAESRRASMVVVGARGRGGLAGLLLGSVSQAVLHHAACPVVVIPAAAVDRGAGA